MEIDDLVELETVCIAQHVPLLGRERGIWLLEKVREIQPNLVLEFGTALGYSTCILGSTGAEVTTIEKDPLRAREAKKFLAQYHISARVVQADGVQVVKQLLQDENNLEVYDIIFLDFAKKRYADIFEDCLLLLKPGGWLIADDFFLELSASFRESLLHHPQLKTEIINIKQGMSCSQKIK